VGVWRDGVVKTGVVMVMMMMVKMKTGDDGEETGDTQYPIDSSTRFFLLLRFGPPPFPIPILLFPILCFVSWAMLYFSHEALQGPTCPCPCPASPSFPRQADIHNTQRIHRRFCTKGGEIGAFLLFSLHFVLFCPSAFFAFCTCHSCTCILPLFLR